METLNKEGVMVSDRIRLKLRPEKKEQAMSYHATTPDNKSHSARNSTSSKMDKKNLRIDTSSLQMNAQTIPIKISKKSLSSRSSKRKKIRTASHSSSSHKDDILPPLMPQSPRKTPRTRSTNVTGLDFVEANRTLRVPKVTKAASSLNSVKVTNSLRQLNNDQTSMSKQLDTMKRELQEVRENNIQEVNLIISELSTLNEKSSIQTYEMKTSAKELKKISKKYSKLKSKQEQIKSLETQVSSIQTTQQEQEKKISYLMNKEQSTPSGSNVTSPRGSKLHEQLENRLKNINLNLLSSVKSVPGISTPPPHSPRDITNSPRAGGSNSPREFVVTMLQSRVSSLEQQLQDTFEKLESVQRTCILQQQAHEKQIQELHEQMFSFMRNYSFPTLPSSSSNEYINESTESLENAY